MLRLRRLVALLSVVCLAWAVQAASANVRLPAIIGNNMVLQQGMNAAIWGWADPGEKVTVTIAGQTKTTTANGEGKWIVYLDPLDYGGPFQLVVSGRNTITLTNVLVGEVWLASGQSNMAMSVRGVRNAEQEIQQANYPRIRLFQVKLAVSLKPKDDVQGAWVECSPETVPGFSAVAYFFGRELHKQLGVPIGLINSSWGGTPAEAWTPLDKMRAHPDLKPIVDRLEKQIQEHPDLVDRFEEYYQQWQQNFRKWWRERSRWARAVEQAKAEGKQPPPPPKPPSPVGSKNSPSVLYNAMIHPLIPFAIRGVIWYQGESNAGRAYQYRVLLPTMIQSWREAWGQGDFPFLIVQLANFMAQQKDPNENSAWAELREAQLLTVKSVPNTGLAVIIDIGEANDIHPKNKQDVGRRLALWALGTTYGRNIIYSGPIYDSMSIEDGKIRLRFKHVGGGLVAEGGGELKGFAIAGEDRKFVWAKARIEGDTVVVWSEEVPKPVAVRYGWANNPVCNLYNAEGLPASPFRTDDWPGVTVDRR